MPSRIIVGIGELAVSNDPEAVVVTHALGSCVAVCLWDEHAGVAGLIHVLLPDSRINPERAQTQPAAFADTGIPLLFHEAYRYGVQKQRCQVKLIGGADIANLRGADGGVGRRNVQAARALLWRNGVLLKGEAVGGTSPRTVSIAVATGQTQVSTAGEVVCEP
jgi:chemotaxis protein CheD